ncbi:MAG: 1-acyl-sn-glycerol-3-phosphate acyltransferase [Parachlamydiaceae bacterium]
MDHFQQLQQAAQNGDIPEHLAAVIHNFYLSYEEAVKENGYTVSQIQPLLNQFLQLVIKQLKSPDAFELFHHHIKSPFNYYTFGLDFIRPLVIFSKSTVLGENNIQAIEASLAQGDNVILLANHQTEPDPQAISLLLEKHHPKLAEEMIFVAGHRVISDPLATPFSKGRNLLCIYSKRHIENEPETKAEKLSHNQRTMKKMVQLLDEGGKCIYVAPSGGRDRPCPKGEVGVAKFDPQSIEMFWLMTQQAGKKTHFYPLALATYDLLPPPHSIDKALGERRHAHSTPIHLSFGSPIDMSHYPGSDDPDKKKRREHRAEYIWNLVAADYLKF